MIHTDTGFLIFAAGGAALCLLVLILTIRILKAGSGNRKKALENNSAGNDEKAFEKQMIGRILAQQTETVLCSIEKTVRAERDKLKNGMSRIPDPQADSGDVPSDMFVPAATEKKPDDQICKPSTNYSRINALRENGSDNNEISRQLMIPRAEVSLYLKMNPA